MWHCYAYHNNDRPFADHARKDRAKTQIKEGLKLDSTPVRWLRLVGISHFWMV